MHQKRGSPVFTKSKYKPLSFSTSTGIRKMLTKKAWVSLLGISIALTLITPLGASASASPVSGRDAQMLPVKTSALSKLKIVASWNSNNLTARLGPTSKKQKVSYQWLLNRQELPGQTSKTYTKQITDCSNDLQVRVTIQEKGKKLRKKTSSKYNPAICEFTSGPLPAFTVLHNCGIPLPSPASPPACTEWTYNGPGGFYGFAYKDAKAQPWFRIPFGGIDPSRVISWRAQAQGLFHDYTRSLTMITKNEPSWSCCDWKGTKFPGRTFPVSSMVSDEVLGISADGAAYVGFNFYDPYGVSESLVVDTIQVTIKYRG
jgi:hypothetical protein